MNGKITREMMDQLRTTLEAGFDDKALEKIKKTVKDALIDAEQDLEYSLKEDMAGNLSWFVADMAEKTVEALLKGDEAEMLRYLSCAPHQYHGRDHQHSVIHGKLFEPGPLELRRKIVDAFPELLKNERILDLESQVAALTEQIAREQKRADDAWERYRSAA